MNQVAYEARKAGIKRMRDRAKAELLPFHRPPGRVWVGDYAAKLRRYREIRDYLAEFIRHNNASRVGGARAIFLANPDASPPARLDGGNSDAGPLET